MNRLLLLPLLAAVLAGCYGSPIHETVHYNGVRSHAKKANAGLLSLRIGMAKTEVQQLLGTPERSEGYAWGSVWLYRTAMTTGVYGTSDSDFTPVVFDSKDVLEGWGRNYFTERVRKYEVDLKVR